MAYAKLSGALLVRKDAPPTKAVSVPQVIPPPAPNRSTAGPEANRSTAGPEALLARHLKSLKLPTFLAQYEKLSRQYAAEGLDPTGFLLRLAEMELLDRERLLIERRVKQARFPAVKSLDTYDFAAIPSLDKNLVLELARCEYIARQENVIAIGDRGTGKTHLALALGLAACQKGFSVAFTSASSLMQELAEARNQQQLVRLQRRLVGYKLLIVDDLAYATQSTVGAGLLFDVIGQRYEHGSTIMTSDLPFEEWVNVFGSARLTGTMLDRLTHRAHVLRMRGDSYRIRERRRSAPQRHVSGREEAAR